MNLIDTHAHLFESVFRDDIHAVIERAHAVGIRKVLMPNIDADSILSLKETCKINPTFLIPMMGLHPTSVDANWQQQLNTIYHELISAKYIAVGEIGIDLYWDRTFEQQQIAAFEEQLRWSVEKELPVSIHSRNATAEVLQCIRKVGSEKLRGVFHSFEGSLEELEAVLALPGFCVGINGIVTFKKSALPDTLAHCPLERIVLETDSPYLSPVPHRGKRNEPSYLTEIVHRLSMIYGLSDEEIAATTSENAERIFGISRW